MRHVATNRKDMSQNRKDMSQNRKDISQNRKDMSQSRNFLRHVFVTWQHVAKNRKESQLLFWGRCLTTTPAVGPRQRLLVSRRVQTALGALADRRSSFMFVVRGGWFKHENGKRMCMIFVFRECRIQ
jgi:hypothetical protein